MTCLPPISPDDLARAADLFDTYASRLLGRALRYVPNEDEANDLIFAACIKVARNARARQAPERTLPKALEWVSLDAYRHAHRQRQLPLVHGLDFGLLADAGRRASLSEARVDVLHAAIERLDEGDRELITRRHLDGESGAAIARSLGLSCPAVRKRLERARARLEQILLELGWQADGDHDDDFPVAA